MLVQLIVCSLCLRGVLRNFIICFRDASQVSIDLDQQLLFKTFLPPFPGRLHRFFFKHYEAKFRDLPTQDYIANLPRQHNFSFLQTQPSTLTNVLPQLNQTWPPPFSWHHGNSFFVQVLKQLPPWSFSYHLN